MSTLVIVNPKSGSVQDLSEVVETLRRHPAWPDVEVRIPGDGEDAARLAAEAARGGVRQVLAAGGDGTLHEVVNGVLSAEGVDPPPRVGILPLGTGNDFARTLGLPLDLEAAFQALADGRGRPLDLARGRCGGEGRWLVNASAGGFSGRVDEALEDEVKEAWGPLAYARTALDLLPDPETYEVDVRVDGETAFEGRVLNVVVANGRSVAGGVRVAPEALLDDGRLDVVIVLPGALRELAGVGSRMAFGRHLDHDLVVHARGAAVEVRSDPPMPFNFDGELAGDTPLELEVVPGAIQLLVPPGGDEAFSGGAVE